MKSKTMLNVLAVFLALGMLFCLIPSDVTAGNADPRRGALIKDAVLDEINKDSVDTIWVRSQKDQTDTTQDNYFGEDKTIEVNFAFESLNSTTISGVVSDGGIEGTPDLHGYPLYAKLTFTNGTDSQSVFTNPFTGAYSTSLLQATEYIVEVESLVGDYLPYTDTLTINEATYTYDVGLFVPAQGCRTPGYGVSGTAVNVNFNDNSLPVGWSVVDYDVKNQVWRFDNPGGRSNLTGGTDGFAIVDSDYYGYNGRQSTGLRTPTMNFSSYSEVIIEFFHYFEYMTDNSGAVKYSLDNGVSWNLLWVTGTEASQGLVTIDATEELAGEPTVIIEFHYQDANGWFYELDDILIVDPTCEILEGGVVAGYVYSTNEPDFKLIDATVATAANSVTTAASDDEAGNGLYWKFEPTDTDPEDVEFTISNGLYVTRVETRSVSQDEINHYDFMLDAGHIESDTLQLEMTMELGTPDQTQTFTLNNVGSSTSQFTILEKYLGSDPLAYAIEVRSTKTFYRIPEIEVPGTWEAIAPLTPTFFAGDFLGDYYSHIYAISESNVLYTIKTITGTATPIMPLTIPGGTRVQGITGAEGFFYGTTTNCGSSTNIFTLDPVTGTIEVIVETNIKCGIDIAFVPDKGLLYSVDTYTDHLFSINPETGTVIDVGELGFPANNAQGMDYDEENQILYWAAYGSDGNGQLRVINMETGGSALVGEFPGDNQTACFAIASGNGGVMDRLRWLTEDPVEGNVVENGSTEITLTYSVAAIGQPKDYLGELVIETDTPYPYLSIPVTFHVTRPPSYAGVTGDVYALEKCDINPMLAEDVYVKFYQDGTLKYSTTTDEFGQFGYVMPDGIYDIEFTLGGYVSQLFEGVVLGPGADIVMDDINLRLDAACLVISPKTLVQVLYADQTASQTLTLTNSGARSVDFEITEVPSAVPVSFAENLLLASLGNFFDNDVEPKLDAVADVLWLSESLTSGIISAGESVQVIVSFDALDLISGDYFATLRVNNAPSPAINLPVTLRVMGGTPLLGLYLPLILR